MRKLVLLFTAAALAVPAAATAKTVTLKAKLKGSNEVPSADSDGKGRAEIRLNAKTGKVCYEIHFKNIEGADQAHIHKGRKGKNGNIVVPLYAGATKGELEGCAADIPASTIKDIVNKPKAFYVNVHNIEFPAGAIRGQLHED